MEPPFDKLDGVLATTSGYTGGSKVDPTYEEVSAGGTGHAEAVQVTYDPAKVSYDRLLEVFWRNVDPLDAGGQFCDRGEQYRTAIFVHDEEQRRLAEQSKQALVDSKRFDGPIVTEIVDGRPVLSGRGISSGLLREEPAAVQVLPLELRARPAPRASVGRAGDPLTAGGAESGPSSAQQGRRLSRGLTLQ